MLLDVTFKKFVSQPKETVKEINKYFAMGFTPDVEQALDSTLNDSNTQKMVKLVVPDEKFTCDKDEINKGFGLYQDNFKANIFFIVYGKKKSAPLAMNFFREGESSQTSILL